MITGLMLGTWLALPVGFLLTLRDEPRAATSVVRRNSAIVDPDAALSARNVPCQCR